MRACAVGVFAPFLQSIDGEFLAQRKQSIDQRPHSFREFWFHRSGSEIPDRFQRRSIGADRSAFHSIANHLVRREFDRSGECRQPSLCIAVVKSIVGQSTKAVVMLPTGLRRSWIRTRYSRIGPAARP